MTFEDTHSDSDFERTIIDPHDAGFAEALDSDPDLAVDGLRGSLVSRLLGFFGMKAD